MDYAQRVNPQHHNHFFTTAKPFVGHNGVIQRNALRSWTLLHPGVEVILFGKSAVRVPCLDEIRPGVLGTIFAFLVRLTWRVGSAAIGVMVG